MMTATTLPFAEQQEVSYSNMPTKALIYMVDLTHTGQLVASNTHPLAAGLIAGFIKTKLSESIDVEIFKYPQELSAALEVAMPAVIGFSNYSWNANLSYEYVQRIKARAPRTAVVFGGPNYGLAPEEQQAFWRRYPLVDFYILKEGELAMTRLLEALAPYNYDPRPFKAARVIVPSTNYMDKGELIAGELLPRIKNLNEIPSPYLMGMMDKFFDDTLIPMTFTTRGCPFTCSFCTEGLSYYQKISERDNFGDDLEYMAQRVGSIQDILITDANFGMYRQDIEKAKTLADIKKRYGWPQHIHVSGGKNQKERLLNVANILEGTMNVAASLQSTNAEVLSNVRRTNISLEQLNHVGAAGNTIDANTYAEIILGLPGDSVAAHTQSVRDAVNAGLSFIRLYQLIMLLETDMNTPQTRERFGMQTKFRVMPRCFGVYTLFGEKFTSVETEEICVAQNSLSLDDYVECRELDLTVEITHNVNMFRELLGLTRRYQLSWFDFLMRFHAKRRTASPLLAELYDTFKKETLLPLWESRDELESFAKTNLDRYILDELGTNELFKGKTTAFFRLQEELHHALYSEMRLLLAEHGHLDQHLEHYLAQLERFSRYRKEDLLASERHYEDDFHYDFEALLATDFSLDHRECSFDQPVRYSFQHSAAQRKQIESYITQYGTDTVGLGRILMRAHVKRLFREVHIHGQQMGPTSDQTYRRALNLYGD